MPRQVQYALIASPQNRAKCPLRDTDPPQARAALPLIHPTIPARFLVTTCTLPSPTKVSVAVVGSIAPRNVPQLDYDEAARLANSFSQANPSPEDDG